MVANTLYKYKLLIPVNYSISKSNIYLVLLGFMMMLFSCSTPTDSYFRIRVIDSQTGRGVPLVKLIPMTRNQYITDSQGYIAFSEPGLMDQVVYFVVESDGYEVPIGADGKRSVLFNTKHGTEAILRIRRNIPAERLYRLTGQGIYKDSEILGISVPIRKPLLNAGVLGQDSQLGAIYNGKYFWIWGDTFLPPRYIGNFAVSSATSPLEDDPDKGINYTYFMDDNGYSRSMIDPQGPGYIWFDWLMTIRNGGEEQLLAKFGRVNGYWLNEERGIALFNDDKGVFERVIQTPEWKDEYTTMGHPVPVKINDDSYYITTSEFRFSMVKRTFNDITDPSGYLSFSCLKEGSRYDLDNLQLDRDSNGKLVFGWKSGTDPIDFKRQEELIKEGHIRQNEGWLQISDILTGEREVINRGSIFWNSYRQKWIMIASGNPLGEVWYSEADTPVGPWAYSLKIADHVNAFYNPKHHPYFDKEDGKQIYFEGTYTKGWRPEASITPYYHYNQLMYTLRLDEEDVFLPEPVYYIDPGFSFKSKKENAMISFFAFSLERKNDEMIPIYISENGKLSTYEDGNQPLFYALGEPELKNGLVGTSDNFLRNFELFENFFKADFDFEEQLTFKSNMIDFELSDFMFFNDSISSVLNAYNRKYFLEGRIENDMIQGRWKSEKGNYEGDWESYLNTEVWWPAYSKNVVPLYEFFNGTEYRYGTEEYMGQGWERSSQPICWVWANPFDQLIVDWSIEPDSFIPARD